MDSVGNNEHLLRSRVGAVFLFLIQFLVGGAVATATDPEALILRGIEYRRADRNLEALKLFQQAYELQESPRTLAQMGMAEQALGKWGAADRHLRQALQSGEDAWIRKNRARVGEALGVIASHVGKLDVTGTPVGAEVRVDGELIGLLPFSTPISVTAGGVAIEVRASGHLPIVRAATVAPGALVRESFALQSFSPLAEPTRTVPPVAEPRRLNPDSPSAQAEGERSHSAPPPKSVFRLRRPVTWGIAGLGLGSLAFGVFQHLSWQRKVGSFQNMIGCDGRLEMRGGTACEQLYDDGQSAKTLAFLGYGLGAGLAVAAAILFLTEPDPSPETTKLACSLIVMGPGIGCLSRF